MDSHRMRVWNWTRTGLLFLVLVLSLLPIDALAGPSRQTAGGGLQVSNALLTLNATPGQVYVHQMVVSSGPTAPAMDVTVEARGFGESLEGAFLPLEAAQDTSPYSARAFITKIGQPSFHLDPGGSVPLAVTVSVPADLGSDTRYAMIYIHSQPVNAGNGVGQILAVSVPVVITPQGAQMKLTGKISELKVAPVEAGKPIAITTTVQNTGNHHFKVQGQATISDSSGKEVADLSMPLTNNSIIPTYAERLGASYSALDRPNGLAPGTYTVLVKVTREDGTLVDTAQTTFVVTAPLQICPGVDPDHMLVTSFNDEEPGTVDARDKAHVQVTFENAGKVTGQVAVCEYSQEPPGSPRFSDRPGDGGAGGTAVRFFTVRVDGFNQGTARLAVTYQPGELAGLDPNSLFLATRQGTGWSKLDNLSVQTGAQLVLGELPVNRLAEGPLIAMGGTASGLQGLPILIGGGALLLLILLVLFWLLLGRSRRGKKSD